MWIFECYAIISEALVVLLKVRTGERMILHMLVLCVCIEFLIFILERKKKKKRDEK